MSRKPHTVTIKDLAADAEVSPATVSRVLNNSGYVSETTRKRVEQTIKTLGYRPDIYARSLRGMPSGLVALVIPNILNVFYTQLSQAIEDKLRQLGYTMLLGISKDDPTLYMDYLNHFWDLKVEGVIGVPPCHNELAAQLRSLVIQGLPIVEVNRKGGTEMLDAVVANNFQGACQATEHLLQLGHERIAFIVGSADTTTGQQRDQGFRWAMTNAGLTVAPEMIKVGEFSKTFGIQAMTELLNAPERPTAVIATSNRILMGVMTVLNEQGVRVPDDLSVISFDDSEWLSFWQPPITTIDIAVDEMGDLAVKLLLRWIDAGEPPETPRTYSLSTTIIERQSCATIKG